MKTLLAFLTFAATAASGRDNQALVDSRFNLLNLDYKKPQMLTESFFNPFKVQADFGLAKKEGPGVTNESVAAAIGHRGVSGIVYLSGHGTNRAIIGDQVFAIGDELTFPGGEKAGTVPLVLGATVVLREVDRDRLTVDVSGEGGETPRRVTFPLRNFWQP